MRKNIFFITAGLLLSIGVNAQVVTSSKLNPVQQNPDTIHVSNSQQAEKTNPEVNSGTKTIVVAPESVLPLKKEEETIEPVNTTSTKNPK